MFKTSMILFTSSVPNFPVFIFKYNVLGVIPIFSARDFWVYPFLANSALNSFFENTVLPSVTY